MEEKKKYQRNFILLFFAIGSYACVCVEKKRNFKYLS